MTMFANMTRDGMEQTRDTLGGRQLVESGIHIAKIKTAYAGKWGSGANFIGLTFQLVDSGVEYSELITITNKEGNNFFLNKNDPTKKVPMPGFVTVDDICIVATDGKALAEQAVEEKVLKLYDAEAKAEINKSVPVLVDLIGMEVALGIHKISQNKSVKDGAGNYVASAEVEEVNQIVKVFHPTMKFTVTEVRAEAPEPLFWTQWSDKYTGKLINKVKDAAPSAGGAPTAGSTPQASAARPSLFGNKK